LPVSRRAKGAKSAAGFAQDARADRIGPPRRFCETGPNVGCMVKFGLTGRR